MTADAAPLAVMIVDDEAPARRRLRELIADCAAEMPLTVTGEAANGRAALEFLAEQSVDVVLLDIRMPDMDGIELARHLGNFERPPAVIFTTAYDVYAIRAFEVHAIDYLLKPIRATRLREALARARAAARPNAEALEALQAKARAYLSAPERGRVHLIPIAEVIYLKAELKYVTVRTAEREYLIEESLARLETEFGERFIRVHRNCLVAKASIRTFEREADEGEGHWVVLLNACDERIAVSRRQQHVIRELTG
ncbi:MAG: LytTR family DNA-binding domain-containing protein [Betaproteobacteria bacterium]|nr:LytTR family DNA-binding domain-containing protein [Betaproteobacteria bacterium]